MTDKSDADLLAQTGGFEWDENKRLSNIAKHRIDFADAREVFGDPRRWIYRSPRQLEEVRYVCVGLMRGVVIAVVFTLRQDRIRLVSARVASRNEREQYG
jgi:hypothetical protein